MTMEAVGGATPESKDGELTVESEAYSVYVPTAVPTLPECAARDCHGSSGPSGPAASHGADREATGLAWSPARESPAPDRCRRYRLHRPDRRTPCTCIRRPRCR